MEIIRSTARELMRALQDRSISSREIVAACLQRIHESNSKVVAMVHVAHEQALEAASQIDARRARGESLSPYAGMPIVLKDLVCTQDMPTTCGSKILQDYRPPYDAGIVQRIRSHDMVILGKANMDEFAMGGSTETGIAGPTHNPWDLSRTAGGSSGGSAASVASGMTPWSIGSDTGGSIRQPAAHCGVCGLKPTYGRVSRYGLVAFASSLDQLGPMAHTVDDLALLLNVIAGPDDRDSTCLNVEVGDYETGMGQPLVGLRIGVIREQVDHEGLDPEIRSAIQNVMTTYREAGAKIVDVSLPHTRFGVPAYYVIATCEASSNLSRYDGAHYGFRAHSSRATGQNVSSEEESALIDMYCQTRSQGFGVEVKRRIMLGTYALSAGYYDAYYLKALQVRRLIRRDYDEALKQVDVLLGPTTPSPAFILGEKLNDPVQMYLVDLFTVGANLSGLPALAVPCGNNAQGLPIGFQMHAAPLAESTLLRAGAWYQSLVSHIPQIR